MEQLGFTMHLKVKVKKQTVQILIRLVLRGSLIHVCTVCSDISVPMLRIFRAVSTIFSICVISLRCKQLLVYLYVAILYNTIALI